MSVINTNYLALVSQNNLVKSQNALGQAIERLSSGLRINSAKDDAAGQAIANRFTANVNGLTQAARNANDGISIAQTTEGSLNEINENLQRIRTLSVQAANGSNSADDLTSIQNEIQERLDEIDRVSRETQFNGKYVLGEDGVSLSVQVGAHDNQRIEINLSRIDSNTLGLNGYNVNNVKTSDMTDVTASVAGVGQTPTNVAINPNSAVSGGTPPLPSGVTAEAVYRWDDGGGNDGLAVKTADGDYFELNFNAATDQYVWDSGDPSTVVDSNHIQDDPLTSLPTNLGIGTLWNNSGAAGSAVTVVGAADITGHAGVDVATNLDTNAALVQDGANPAIYYSATANQHYVQVVNSDTQAQDGFYAVTVDADTGAITAIALDGANTIAVGSEPADIATVSTVAGAPGQAVNITFADGLFARNDVNPTVSEDGNTITQRFAAKDGQGDYYEVIGTFTFTGADRSNPADYTVAFSVNTTSSGAVQVSPGNIDGAAVTDLTVGNSPLDANEDLLNLDLSTAPGITQDGLYAVNGGGYAVKGSDGSYYAATAAADGFTFNWDSDSAALDATTIGALTTQVGVDTEGGYTGLAAGEALVSYKDSNGDTQFAVRSGTGDDAIYTKAVLADADPVTGDIAVSKSTADDAQIFTRTENPLAALDSALQQVDDLRSHLGAIQNRFESTIANLSNTVNNLSAARSRIEDADYAVEVSNMTRAQILQQAGTSVLAQANQIPQTVLSLLR